jgi:hypothetical protein
MQAEIVRQASSAPSVGALSTETEKIALRFRGTLSIKPAPDRMIEYVFDLDTAPLTADTVQGYIRRKISLIRTEKIIYTITTERGQFQGGLPIEKDLKLIHGQRSQEDSDGITLSFEGPHIFDNGECLLDNHLTPEKEAHSKIFVNNKLKEQTTGVYCKGKFQYGTICAHISLNKQIPLTIAYMSTKLNDKDSLCCLYSEETGDIHAIQNAELNTRHTIWFIIKTKDEALCSIKAVSNIQNPFITHNVLETLPGGTLFQSNHFFSPPQPTNTLWEIAGSMEGQLTYTKHLQATLYKLDNEKQAFWRQTEEILILMGRIKTRFIASTMPAPTHTKVETQATHSTQQAELDELLAEWKRTPKALKPKHQAPKPTPSKQKTTPTAPNSVDEAARSIGRTSSTTALTIQQLSIKSKNQKSIPHTKPMHQKSPIHTQPNYSTTPDYDNETSLIISPIPSLRGKKQSRERCSELWIASHARKDEIGETMTKVDNEDQIESEIVLLLPQLERTGIPEPLSPLLPGEIRIPNFAPTPIANWSLTP